MRILEVVTNLCVIAMCILEIVREVRKKRRARKSKKR